MSPRDYAHLAEQFLARLYREEYLHLAGLKDTFETEEIFRDCAALFTREAVRERLDNRRDREGRHLAEFAAHGHIAQRLRGLTERIANQESAAEVEWEGERLPFRAACRRLTVEANAEKRRALDRGVAEAIARQNPDRAARIAGQRAIAQELGFTDYRALCEELSGQRLQALAAEALALLEATAESYRRRVQQALREVGVSPEEATGADLRWLMLAPRYQDLLSRERLLPAAEGTLRRLGRPLAEQEGVRLDLEPRPRKYPRPFCSPLRAPGEVYVVAAPVGGLYDFLSFFHELGHAEHFAHISPRLPVHARMMGDAAVCEAWAFVLQSVVLEREWLGQVMEMLEIPAGLLAFGQLVDLWCVRRCAGRLLYELELHSGEGEITAMPQRHEHLLEQALAVRADPKRYLFDLEDQLYSARYLRGYLFDASVRERLRELLGPSWFLSHEGGTWLQARWAQGQELTVEELAEALGVEFSRQPLQERLLARV